MGRRPDSTIVQRIIVIGMLIGVMHANRQVVRQFQASENMNYVLEASTDR